MTGSTPGTAGTEPMTRDAFARALEEHRALFLCLAASVLGARTGAEDVVQEAAIVGLSKLGGFEPGTCFTAWMGRIVRYLALNQARKTARSGERRHATDVERLSGRTSSSPIAIDFDDRLMRALASLSENARASLLLLTVLELDYREIARVLEIPEGTAMSHVHRSREALRRALSEEERR